LIKISFAKLGHKNTESNSIHGAWAKKEHAGLIWMIWRLKKNVMGYSGRLYLIFSK